MACKQRTHHHHARAKAHALGNIAVAADAAIGNDRLGRDAGAPFERRELPAARAKAGFELGDADLAGADAHFGGVSAPVFQINHGLGRAHIARNHEAARQMLLQIANHVFHAVGMAVGDVDGDVVRR